MSVLIVRTKGKWFVRRVYSVTHDLPSDHMIYRCDRPLGGGYKRLADVPLVQRTAQASKRKKK